MLVHHLNFPQLFQPQNLSRGKVGFQSTKGLDGALDEGRYGRRSDVVDECNYFGMTQPANSLRRLFGDSRVYAGVVGWEIFFAEFEFRVEISFRSFLHHLALLLSDERQDRFRSSSLDGQVVRMMSQHATGEIRTHDMRLCVVVVFACESRNLGGFTIELDVRHDVKCGSSS